MAEPGDLRQRWRELPRFQAVALLGLCGAAILVVVLILFHVRSIAAERDAREDTQSRGPVVRVTAVQASSGQRTLQLFADVRAYQEVTLYGKVSGYLKTVLVDKGDSVGAGQRVAEIESAETDAQYASALADLATKRRLAVQDEALSKQGAIGSQTTEQAEDAARMAKATVDQLATLKSYEILVAPFAGRVTARFADPGALVQNAETSETTSLPVVTISDQTRLRIDAYVQQADAPFVHAGDAVEIADAASADRKVTATLTRTSGELDPRTRTLLVEVELPNPNGFMVGGSFAYMTLHIAEPSYPQVPVNALVNRSGKVLVAIPGEGGIVHFAPVTIASDDGTTARILTGVRAGERVALDVPDDVTEGSRIQPAAAP
jgi:membrane fusion protein, multidrug efflux system